MSILERSLAIANIYSPAVIRLRSTNSNNNSIDNNRNIDSNSNNNNSNNNDYLEDQLQSEFYRAAKDDLKVRFATNSDLISRNRYVFANRTCQFAFLPSGSIYEFIKFIDTDEIDFGATRVNFYDYYQSKPTIDRNNSGKPIIIGTKNVETLYINAAKNDDDENATNKNWLGSKRKKTEDQNANGSPASNDQAKSNRNLIDMEYEFPPIGSLQQQQQPNSSENFPEPPYLTNRRTSVI